MNLFKNKTKPAATSKGAPEERTVTWLRAVCYFDQGKKYQVGLRSDGVVVWRPFGEVEG